MLIVGLTGGSGSGKSFFAKAFSCMGAGLVDADRVYRELVECPSPCTDELAHSFGTEILDRNGGLDRSKMRTLVFGDSLEHLERRELLNSITHRYVKEEILRLVEGYRAAGYSAVLLDVPLLFESGMEVLCDTVIAVIAPREARLARIMARDGIKEEAAAARLSAQPPDSFYIDRADILVENNKDSEAFFQMAKEIAAGLLMEAEKK